MFGFIVLKHAAVRKWEFCISNLSTACFKKNNSHVTDHVAYLKTAWNVIQKLPLQDKQKLII